MRGVASQRPAVSCPEAKRDFLHSRTTYQHGSAPDGPCRVTAPVTCRVRELVCFTSALELVVSGHPRDSAA